MTNAQADYRLKKTSREGLTAQLYMVSLDVEYYEKKLKEAAAELARLKEAIERLPLGSRWGGGHD